MRNLNFLLLKFSFITRRWRMIVNCAEEKTEIICFGTAENDASLVPDTFKLGNSSIRFVEKTKVLGLIMEVC